MPVFYTHRNREELADKAKAIPEDLFIPFNAGRQLTLRKRGAPGEFYHERPANGVSLKQWANQFIQTNVSEVADVSDLNDINDPKEGDIAIVNGDAVYIYTEDNGWVLISTVSGLLKYDPITDLTVTANMPGITAIEASGILTITIPTNTSLFRIDYKGTQSDLDGSDNLTIVLDYQWDNGYNLDYDTVFTPNVELWDRTLPIYNSNVIDSSYYLRKVQGSPPEVHIIGSSSNTLTLFIENLSSIQNWGVSITL